MLFPELSEFSTETKNTQNGIDFLFIDGQHKIKQWRIREMHADRSIGTIDSENRYYSTEYI